MQDEYVMSSYLVDLEDNIERPTRAVMKQGGWFFAQIGTYTSASPLHILDNAKTKISFAPSGISYSESRNFTLNYDVVNNKFHPVGVGNCYLFNLRFKLKASSQAGHLDVLLESPTVSFNPIMASTLSFNKQAGDEQFHSVTGMIYISQDVSTNGLEVYMQPHGTAVDVYDISLLASTQYLDS